MKTETPIAASDTIKFAALPTLGTTCCGGTFAGVITRKDGVHFAVILLPGKARALTWKKAGEWAAEQGGELPTRPVAALLFANVQNMDPLWHWTPEECNKSYAWDCNFGNGYQYYSRNKSAEGAAVAVRCIRITA